MRDRHTYPDMSVSAVPDDELPIVIALAGDVVRAFLKHVAAHPRMITAERELPHPKAVIKAAIMVEAVRLSDPQSTLLYERLFLQLAGYRPDSEIAGCRELVAKLGEIADASLTRSGGEGGRIKRAFGRASPAEVESYRATIDARNAECLALAVEWQQANDHSFQ